MKFKYLKKLLSFIIFCFLLLSSSIWAKDLLYQGEIVNNYSDSFVALRWTNYVKAKSQNSAPYDYDVTGGPVTNHSILDNYGGSDYYQTRGVTFHKRPMTIYSDSKGVTNSYFLAFDYNSEPFKLFTGSGDEVYDLESYKSRVNIGATWLNGKNDDYGEILSVDNWNNEHNGYDAYNVKGTTNNYFTINTFQLNNRATVDLIEKLQAMPISNNSYEIYFSGQLHTGWGTSGIYNNAYDFVKNMGGAWENSNYGWKPIDSWTSGIDKNWHNVLTDGVKARSVLNNFDNKIRIPVRKRNIFVAHVIEGSGNQKITTITNSQLEALNGEIIENRYAPNQIDENGWQEKYTTGEGLITKSANNGSSQVEYNGKTYKCVRASVFLLDGNTDWANPLWTGQNVTSSTIDKNSNDYGVIYFYSEIDLKPDIEVYVNYIDQTTMETVESFKTSLDTTILGNFVSAEVDKAPYPHKFIMDKNGSGNISVKQTIFNKTESLTYNGNSYKYVGLKYAAGSDYNQACINGDANSSASPNGSCRGIGIVNPGQKKVYIVSFYFKPWSPGPPGGDTSTDLNISGRLDFINTNSQFISATYRNNSDDAAGASGLDFIPAGENLSPYIYGVQPYFIKAVDYSNGNSSKNLSVTLTGEWTVDPGCDEGCPDDCDTDHSYTESKSYTYNATVNHRYYKIDNFIMYRISNVAINDSSSNIGGKLFSSSSTGIATSSSYASRSTATITDHNLEASFSYSSSTVSAGDDPTAAEVAEAAGLKVVGKASNDYITLDGSTAVVVKNEKNVDKEITSETGNTINVDTTSGITYLGNINDYMKGTVAGKSTTYNDFDYNSNLRTVDSSIQNGIRQLTGTITYSKYNVRGGTSNFTADKILNNIGDVNTVEENKSVSTSQISSSFTSTYDNEGDNNANRVRRVNVLTPLSISASIETDDSVNHSNVSNSILQTGKEFTVTVSPKNYTSMGYNNVDTSNYIQGYYLTFDFQIEYKGGDTAKVYNGYSWDTIHNGDIISANADIYIDGNSTVELKGISTETSNNISAWSTSNDISVVAVAKTINGTKLRKVFDSDRSLSSSDFNNYSNWIKRYSSWGNFFEFQEYVDTSSSTQAVNNRTLLTSQVTDSLLNRSDLYASSNHAVRKTITTNNVGRIFGFIITDCNDLGYKDVFRETSNDNNSIINKHSNVVYYSGKKYFDYANMLSLTNAFMQEDLNRKTLLPLGPYKNTNSTYIFAPKLGYRISYNLKTSGYYTRGSSTKNIKIEPKYYYISKDGSKYIDNIKLYYKDSSGKFKEFVNSGYNIYFKPNDGYRYGISSSDIDLGDYRNLSTKMKKLNISNTMTLDTSMMLTESAGYIQNWYGEYKLPNSTIAVNMSDGINGYGHTSVNNPLRDGYIGVIFKIKSIESRGGTTIETYYDKNDSTVGGINTSQWDYEGYMGVTAGQSASLGVQLEKGVWHINNNMYQDIKGTVILYDIDDRAANDFN